jgi:hypothetical protein
MDLTIAQESKIVRIRAYITQAELFAKYWMAMATTGAAMERTVHRGDNTQFTPMELTQEALDTALRHIHSVDKAANNLALILEGREQEITQ